MHTSSPSTTLESITSTLSTVARVGSSSASSITRRTWALAEAARLHASGSASGGRNGRNGGEREAGQSDLDPADAAGGTGWFSSLASGGPKRASAGAAATYQQPGPDTDLEIDEDTPSALSHSLAGLPSSSPKPASSTFEQPEIVRSSFASLPSGQCLLLLLYASGGVGVWNTGNSSGDGVTSFKEVLHMCNGPVKGQRVVDCKVVHPEFWLKMEDAVGEGMRRDDVVLGML